jgi:hypothetical protein
MKALLRDYLASLRERDELDAILPDLLSGLGFNVITRPGRGTTQRGVDVAAVGPGEKGKETLWLFCVKPGSLGRTDWDTGEQSVRQSLNEILDSYLPHRVQPRHRNLPVIICLAIGGEIQETVSDLWSGYTKQVKKKVKFDCWNGDKLADLLLTGILREEFLPKPFRSSFQKAVAMVDTPDVSVSHFAHLMSQLHSSGQESPKAAVRVARQINICLWVLYVWARDVGNAEAPYRASEKAVLVVWGLMRPQIGKHTAIAKSLVRALHQVINLHHLILTHYIQEKIGPHVELQHGLTMAVGSSEAIDISLALFEVLGRISLLGLWKSWMAERQKPETAAELHAQAHQCIQMGFHLISNNPTLLLPTVDRQSTDIALFLFLVARTNGYHDDLRAWLTEMVRRFDWTVRRRSRYPCAIDDYHDLARHPVDQSDEYFKEMTSASTFLPLLAIWLHGMQMHAQYDLLAKVVNEKLGHCTLQLWFPDSISEDHLYLGGHAHGRAFHDLTLRNGGNTLIAEIAEVCKEQKGFEKLTAVATGFWPIAMVAFRQQGLPIPPHIWIQAFTSIAGDSADGLDSAETI